MPTLLFAALIAVAPAGPGQERLRSPADAADRVFQRQLSARKFTAASFALVREGGSFEHAYGDAVIVTGPGTD